jgi:hypothetical protein
MAVLAYMYEYVLIQVYKYYCREITYICVFITGKTVLRQLIRVETSNKHSSLSIYILKYSFVYVNFCM